MTRIAIGVCTFMLIAGFFWNAPGKDQATSKVMGQLEGGGWGGGGGGALYTSLPVGEYEQILNYNPKKDRVEWIAKP